MVEAVAKEMSGKADVFGMDVDQAPDTPSRLGIMSIPALVFFKDGKEQARLIGVVKKEKIVDKLKSM